MASELKPLEASPRGEAIVIPAWMTSSNCIEHYRLGVHWFHAGCLDREPGPLTEDYLLRNLKWMSQAGYFKGKRDQWALEHLSFIFGMLSQQQ